MYRTYAAILQIIGIPRNLIAKTRDSYAHHYGVIDFELVWETAVEDIPPPADFCREYLKRT